MLIGQDVEDLLFQLVGGHMISVLGGTDEVVAHFLLLPAIRRVLGTVRLEESGRWRYGKTLKSIHVRTKQRSTTTTSKQQPAAVLSVHLKFSMFVYVLRPLSVQDELCFVGNAHNMVLHCMAQKSGREQRNRFIINIIKSWSFADVCEEKL